MEQQVTAKATLQAFCQAWFEERNLNGALGYLTEDVEFIGTGDEEEASGIEEMSLYIRQDIDEMPEPFLFEILYMREQILADNVHNLSAKFRLRNTMYQWHLRAFCVLGRTCGQWKIRSIHFAEPSRAQRNGEHYPETLVIEQAAKLRDELLEESMPGGMIGCYLEPRLPLYFINKRMLDYLGYVSEEEFQAQIQGSLLNCIYPEDRQNMQADVFQQIEEKGEYAAEYRMRKKDGTYIWVHDAGRGMQTEDDREVLISVCIDITRQRQSQEEVLNIYNNIPGAVFRCKFDNVFSVIDANDGLFEFIGYTREEFAAMGNHMASVIYPEDLEIMADKLKDQLKHGNTIHNENRLVCKDGRVRWISIKAQLFDEPDGEQYFYCVFVDITEEKHLHERVRELYEKELAYFAEMLSSGESIQGRINITQNHLESYVSSSETAIVRVGENYDQVVEQLAMSAIDEESAKEIRATLKREKVLQDYALGRCDYHFEFLRRRNDGMAFWGSTNMRTSQNPETGDVIIFFYTSDLTEQKMQELLLKKLATLDYDVISDIDIVRDTHRLISFDSSRADTIPMQGRFQQSIRRIAEKFMDEEARKEYLGKLDFQYMKEQLEHQDSYTFLVEFKDQLGMKRMKHFQVFYISRATGRVCMARRDVSDVIHKEQRQKEELASALVAAEQANAAKSDFLSRMSHEIRTPMNAIIGMSTIAAQSIGDDEQVADCISKIGISSRFLLSLINDILDMSRIESGKMLLKNEKIPTEEFLNGINSICYGQAAAKGVEYECIVDPVLDDYYIGDAMKLQQVLINILSNAIKFTNEGGKVTFSASQRKRSKSSAHLRFIVNDTGIGMSEEFISRIYEPFSQESTGATTMYGGTGLGLAISKSIVDMMDGRIAVRSIKGLGSEFTIDVKLGITEEEKLRHNKTKTNLNFSHLKTLVVDDDVAVCESAMATLKEMGIKAEWVDSGRKAIERVKELWQGKKYVDMILIDWKMPEMDGIETARRIRKIVGPDVTIIIMTAYDWIAIEHEAKLAGVNLLMSKPMFKSSLISAFTRVLNEKEEEKQVAADVYDFTGKRVLLAEDNQINTEVAVMLLESKGFTVDTSENGLRALEKFSKSEAGYYDAILMDIRMPLMDGLAATTNIRHLSNEDARKIPIIAMTANAFDDDIEKSKAAGMNAHLAKPIEPERLYQVMYDFIFGGGLAE